MHLADWWRAVQILFDLRVGHAALEIIVPLSQCCPRDTQVTGFTVVELLAVVTIAGALTALGVPKIQQTIEKARVAQAIGDIHTLSVNLATQDTLPDLLSFVGSVPTDPWGNPYQYNKFPPGKKVPHGARRDRFLVPINTEYDLYSVGKDGATVAPLTAKASQDDVIRANDGGFIGLASNY
jgi:general secretion pathway protein G